MVAALRLEGSKTVSFHLSRNAKISLLRAKEAQALYEGKPLNRWQLLQRSRYSVAL